MYKKKFIIRQEVIAENVHDSPVLEKLTNKENKEKKLWGDSAYKSKEINEMLEKKI